MKTRFSPALLGTFSMMACAFLWSVAGLFIKILDWNPFMIAGMRSLIAFLFLLTIVRTVRLAWSWPLAGAALANAATMLLFVAANKTTTAANAILLQYLAPVFTAMLSVVILKEHIRREQLIALIEPVFNPVWVFLLLGEAPSAQVILGGTLIISSVTAASLISGWRNR
jgi:drug/metabolite transporter (DMT)-like permease